MLSPPGGVGCWSWPLTTMMRGWGVIERKVRNDRQSADWPSSVAARGHRRIAIKLIFWALIGFCSPPDMIETHMLTLFHAPDSRSSRFIWMLEEIGEPYELIYCDIKRASGRGAADPANPHPDKRVPALQNGPDLVTEQAAIALYLTDAFPRARLGASIADPLRAAYLSWLAFYGAEIDVAYRTRAYHRDCLHHTDTRDHERVTARIANALRQGPYLMGRRFTAVDILASGPFEWDPALVGGDDLIRDWLKRLAERPGAARMLELDAPPISSQTAL